jgi:hypothetical protein
MVLTTVLETWDWVERDSTAASVEMDWDWPEPASTTDLDSATKDSDSELELELEDLEQLASEIFTDRVVWGVQALVDSDSMVSTVLELV